MAVELDYAVKLAFTRFSTTTTGCDYYYDSSLRRKSQSKFLEIPTNKSVFEIPVFAMNEFVHSAIENPYMDAVVAELYSIGHTPRYKTVDRYMRDLIRADFSYHHLIELKVPQGSATTLYYVTHGTFFDSQFNPLMMLSWQIERQLVTETGDAVFHFLRPVLRIHPSCCINPSNAIEKFITRKMLPLVLNIYKFKTPDANEISRLFDRTDTGVYQKVKVEIDESPFVLRTVEAPPISITDSALTQVAREHIDELIQ